MYSTYTQYVLYIQLRRLAAHHFPCLIKTAPPLQPGVKTPVALKPRLRRGAGRRWVGRDAAALHASSEHPPLAWGPRSVLPRHRTHHPVLTECTVHTYILFSHSVFCLPSLRRDGHLPPSSCVRVRPPGLCLTLKTRTAADRSAGGGTWRCCPRCWVVARAGCMVRRAAKATGGGGKRREGSTERQLGALPPLPPPPRPPFRGAGGWGSVTSSSSGGSGVCARWVARPRAA